MCRDCRLRFQRAGSNAAKLYELQDAAQVHRRARRRELHGDRDVLATISSSVQRGRLLEVGPGDGRFLAAAMHAGWNCTGVDVSRNLADEARRRSGAEILVGNLCDLNLEAESYDVVNLDGVLMYVPTPVALGREVFRLLRPGGICRIGEYDPDSISARIQGKRYWMYSPTHLLVWSQRSVQRFASLSGLRIVRVFHGTEASLESWLDTEQHNTLSARLRCRSQFVLRKLSFAGLSAAAAKVYYLQKLA